MGSVSVEGVDGNGGGADWDRRRDRAARADARADEGTARFRLQEQPFQILQLLLARPGAVITRDELRDCLWPDGTFVDFEHSVNAAVKRFRAALGDDAKAPRYIETLPRRGYRWIAAALPLRDDEVPQRRPGRIEMLWA
jgi:DNA-binding response OmpR family regulator